ncbi:TniB family NTP-binding protein [Cellulomonas sp. KH9]|uniref:TniB family NTP-binding protein n=1 Tax=Cellulomonas sp. KH9 TaxID=1855324 RepID=UPI0008EDB6E9|nr:TniB family NTP-binding protein [Cellulomonas sp. KH9]SFK12509.1 TniB protein [Cellulomonas sp. KH9]
MTNRWALWLERNDTQDFALGRKSGWNAFVNAAPREQLERLDRTELERLGDEERALYDECRMVWNANLPTINTFQVLDAYDVLDQVMASSRRDGDRLRGTAVVDAPAGNGKTTIAAQFGRDFHRRVYARHGPLTEEGHQRLPVAFVPLAAGMTLKGLNMKILEFYGHPGARKASTSTLGALAVDCVLSCQTKLIIIDDLHFIDFKHRNGMDVSNHLKWLVNEMPATFVYTGVNLTEKRFFDEGLMGEQAAYAQTSRRATRCAVEAFRIDNEAGYRAWMALLRALEKHIVLADAREGMLTDNAREIFRRTQGNIASLTNLLDRACLRATRSGSETIDRDVIDRVKIDNAAEAGAARR